MSAWSNLVWAAGSWASGAWQTDAVVATTITYINSYSGVSTATLGSHQAGDLLIAWAGRDGSVTPPTLPSGWTSIVSGGANTLGFIAGYKIAASSSETSGTWTNATGLIITHYRPGTGYQLNIGSSSSGVNSTGTNAIYPALTLTNTSGSSWVNCFYLHKSPDIAVSTSTTAPLVVRSFYQDATGTLAAHVAESVTSFPGYTVTYTGTTDARRYVSIEILVSQIPIPAGSMSISKSIARNIGNAIHTLFS